MGNQQEVRVPDLGDFDDVEIVEVLVGPGDTVAEEDPLITLETDKAAMEVPSPLAGTIAELKVEVGGRVRAGDVIALLDSTGQANESRASVDDNARDGAHDTSNSPDSEDESSATAAAGSAGDPYTIVVPDLGDFDAADIAEVMIGAGDMLAVEDPLITLETDKAAMEVPSPVAGEVTQVLVAAGDTIGAGGPIAEVKLAGPPPDSKVEPAAAAGQEKTDDPGEPDTQTLKQAGTAPVSSGSSSSAPGGKLPPIDEKSFSRAHASPSVRKFARELGVDLGRVKGSGPKTRILEDDIKAFVKSVMSGQTAAEPGAALPKVPEVDFAKYGEIEVQPLSRIQKISGPRLHASWLNYPHVTQFDEADTTALEGRRQRLKQAALDRGVRLTPLAFVIKACVIALQEFPTFNASMSADQESLVLKKYFHIGFAADTPNGLVVPVIRDADVKDVMSIAQELGELSGRARDGKLTAKEMQGGCFTVSSLGGIGGTHFTPIINAPEVAILGVGRSSQRAEFIDGKFVPRLILPLSLSYDHRVIDGATGVRFTTFLRDLLGDVDRILLGS